MKVKRQSSKSNYICNNQLRVAENKKMENVTLEALKWGVEQKCTVLEHVQA